MDWSILQQELSERGFLHLGFLCVALAYLFRDVFYLRMLAVVGYGFFVLAVVKRGMPDPALLGWYGLFIAVNGVQAGILAHERRREHLTPEERALVDLAFSRLAVGPVRRLMRRGRWVTFPDGFRFTVQDRLSPAVYALLEGEAEISVDGMALTTATPGQFIGEIGFLAGGPATATARARGSVRALAWERGELERAMRRDPELHDTVYAAFGCDLARKVAEQSLKRRGAAAAPAAPPPGSDPRALPRP